MVMPVSLSRGEIALVDDDDFELVTQYKWSAATNRKCKYARTNRKSETPKTVYLHRLLMAAGPGVMVDHINGDGLDCRRANLRLVNPSENARNRSQKTTGSSGFKGVGRASKGNRWVAYIRFNGQTRYLGSFVNKEDAARAYDDAAREAYGEFCCVNFPVGNERQA